MKAAEFAATMAASLHGENSAGASRLPDSYRPATWRGTTPVDTASGELGISFDTSDGKTVRFRLSVTAAEHLIGSVKGFLDAAGASRPVDSEKVRTRTVEFTADQMLLKQLVDRSLPEICADTETGIALLSYCLSELILRTARPGMLPEAVATAVQVLRYNCRVAEPVPGKDNARP